MKKKEQFKEYLESFYINKKTGNSLQSKTISDILSRCKRVETLFDITLPLKTAEIGIIVNKLRAKSTLLGKSKYPYLPYINSLMRYKDFLIYLEEKQRDNT